MNTISGFGNTDLPTGDIRFALFTATYQMSMLLAFFLLVFLFGLQKI
jgi:hypothetical protein